MVVKDVRWTEEEFEKERKTVLNLWPTGKGVDIDEAVQFHKSLLPERNCVVKIEEARVKGNTLIRTSSGVASLEEQIALLKHLEEEGGADILETHVDSMTRNLHFEEAERNLRESLRIGRSLLNGSPIVAYGVANTRRIVESVTRPVMIRSYTPDLRLPAEIALAAGGTDIISAPIGTFFEYSKDLLPERALYLGQYVARLVALYEEKGIPILHEVAGGLAIGKPICLTHAGAIIEALIAARQGVRHVLFLTNAQGNLHQDVAAIMTLRLLAEEYLKKFGYHNTRVSIESAGWSGKHPEDESKAFGVICFSILPGVLGKAELCQIKTVGEGVTIPDKEQQAASLKGCKQVIKMLENQNASLDAIKTGIEAEMIKLETRVIVDRVIQLGDGDVVVGTVNAIHSGVLDWPFATSQFAACKIIAVRDNEGAIRFWDHGNLPFTKEIVEFHKERLAAREKAQGIEIDYGTVVHDLFSISRGYL